jgi:penicillin-binding protein 1A
MTQRARKRYRRSRGFVRRRIFLAVGLVFAVLALAVAGVAAYALSIWDNTPSIDTLKPIKEGSTSVAFAADDSRLGYIQSDTIRHPVESKQVPNLLKYATVAIEDEHFYEHGGVDPAAIIRAAVADVKAGSAVQGGSTITQQLVRNLYISQPQDNFKRKIEEAKLATEYEDKYSKDQILTKYLNTASYGTTDGRTAVGVQAAAETYFNKGVSHLTLPEAAMIAGLPQAPSQYNPFLNPRAALQRRNEVLQAMEEQGYIPQAQYDQASQQDLGLERGYKYETIREPYFFDYVQQQLIDKYGVNTVRNGGLKVYTTINPALQAAAHQAIENHWSDPSGPASALASIDPSNGHIVAMASSGNFSSTQFNLAASGHRQPGSSFKPYVLTAAIRQGMNPDSTYYSGQDPVTLSLGDGTTWTVHNAEPGGGVMSVRDATIHSVNAIFAQLDLDVGPDQVRQTAYDMGITTHLDGIPAEGIGGLRLGVTPLEQADAYATLADGGVRHTATAISKVVFPNGDTDVSGEGSSARAFSDGVASEVTDVLKGVITSGTGTAAGFGCPAAGKTGTTDDFTDAWFVGYTPRLSTGVWVGYPNARASMGSSAFGGTYAAPVWHDYMAVAHGGYCGDFPQPQNPVQFSPRSGGHSVSGRSSSSTGSGSGTSGSYTPPSTGSTTGAYPPQYYAPGAGQGPAPIPPQNNGGGPPGGGGPPPTSGGAGPGGANGGGGNP